MELLIVLVYFFMMMVPVAVVAAFLNLVRRDGGRALPASDVYRLPADGTERLIEREAATGDFACPTRQGTRSVDESRIGFRSEFPQGA